MVLAALPLLGMYLLEACREKASWGGHGNEFWAVPGVTGDCRALLSMDSRGEEDDMVGTGRVEAAPLFAS